MDTIILSNEAVKPYIYKLEHGPDKVLPKNHTDNDSENTSQLNPIITNIQL
jgi:hypothetical protein